MLVVGDGLGCIVEERNLTGCNLYIDEVFVQTLFNVIVKKPD